MPVAVGSGAIELGAVGASVGLSPACFVSFGAPADVAGCSVGAASFVGTGAAAGGAGVGNSVGEGAGPDDGVAVDRSIGDSLPVDDGAVGGTAVPGFAFDVESGA
jgi:hypothetical protein